MKETKRLPDAEFDVMKVIWANEPPVTTGIVMQQLGNEKGWRIQTAVTLMQRLAERGFLRSEKQGRDRHYYPLISKDEYLRFETGQFIKQYHDSSVLNLVTTLYGGDALQEKDIEELLEWMKERRG